MNITGEGLLCIISSFISKYIVVMKCYVHIHVLTGRRMLNVCPLLRSCGTYAPLWSDAVIPMLVGEVSNITAYTSCDKRYKYQLNVMRCSMNTDYDIIYKYTGYVHGRVTWYGSCLRAFCGMN